MVPRYTLETVDGIDRRERHRYPVTSPIALTIFAEGREFTCFVENISLAGAKVRFSGPVALASNIEIAHPQTGRFCGQCKWTTGNTWGIAFTSRDEAIRLCVHCLKQMVPLQRPA